MLTSYIHSPKQCLTQKGDTMRSIAFVTDARAVWGAERSLLGLVRAAEENGFQATIVCTRTSPLVAYAQNIGYDAQFKFADLVIHPAFAEGGLQRAGLGLITSEIVATCRAAAFIRNLSKEFDVIVSFETWRNLEVALGCVLTSSNAVLDMHDVFKGRLGRALNRIAGRLAAASIAPSQFTLDRTGLKGKKSTVVPRATDFPPHATDRSENGPPYRLAVLGEVRSYKRVDLFCEVVLECAQRGIDLQADIVGSINDDDVGRRVQRLVSASNGVLRHVPPTKDVFSLMQKYDYVVNSSSEEAFGRTLIEGLSCGAVPLSFSRSGPAEIINTAKIGAILDDRQGPMHLADQLANILENADLRALARDSGRNAAVQHFSWNKIGRLYYQQIIQALRR